MSDLALGSTRRRNLNVAKRVKRTEHKRKLEAKSNRIAFEKESLLSGRSGFISALGDVAPTLVPRGIGKRKKRRFERAANKKVD